MPRHPSVFQYQRRRTRAAGALLAWFALIIPTMRANALNDEAEDAKILAEKKRIHNAAPAENTKHEVQKETAEPDHGSEADPNGHGRGSHPGLTSERDPGIEEGHGDTHDLGVHDDSGPLKLQKQSKEHMGSHSEDRKEHPSAQAKSPPAFWENGFLWFGAVFLVLAIVLFTFL